jgi:hypothetical protein
MDLKPSDSYREIVLLVPEWQVDLLEQMAQLQGLVTGDIIRRLISRHLAGSNSRACELASPQVICQH